MNGPNDLFVVSRGNLARMILAAYKQGQQDVLFEFMRLVRIGRGVDQRAIEEFHAIGEAFGVEVISILRGDE